MNKQRILIVGRPGTGKTWVMKELIKLYQCGRRQRIKRFWWHTNDEVYVVGKYDGTTFEGSDRFSLAVMMDLDQFLEYTENKITIFEGDRFMNGTFIGKAKPTIIKVLGDGKEGREKRGSNQTETHLKKMQTRVANIEAHYEVNDSGEALSLINELIKKCYERI
jgi:hypothetical protein